jgi:hypothetical protein
MDRGPGRATLCHLKILQHMLRNSLANRRNDGLPITFDRPLLWLVVSSAYRTTDARSSSMGILTDIGASRSRRSRNWCCAKGEARNDGPVRASSKSRNDATAARQMLCDTVRPENCSWLDLRQSVGQRTELVPRAAGTFSNPLTQPIF